MHVKASQALLDQLTTTDRFALLEIYRHRCLDQNLLRKYVYQEADSGSGAAEERVQFMVEKDLLESVDYNGPCQALFLTTRGMEVVKTFFGDVLQQQYAQEGKPFKPRFAYELKMNPKIITHQMHLNAFEMELESYLKPQDPNYRYFDEKHMPKASDYMMPDGVVELSNSYIFLEMDMGTEDAKRLAQKWNSYRIFLNSPGFAYQGKPITMLFILDGIKWPDVRKRNVSKVLLKYIGDRITGNFEVYLDIPEKLHERMKLRFTSKYTVVPEETEIFQEFANKGFSISNPQFLSKLDTSISYYARKLTADKKILIEDGRPQEFLLDIWLDGRLSIARNMTRFQQTTGKLVKMAGREIPYLIVLPSEQAAVNLLKTMDTQQPTGIFFTTPARLAANPWYEALFRFDQLGNLVHFQNNSLTMTVHERRFSKKT